MRGSWVLVRTRPLGKSSRAAWLLIKHKDRYASSKDIVSTKARSVISKRLMVDIAEAAGGDAVKAAKSDPGHDE